jgi:hypothetical protein
MDRDGGEEQERDRPAGKHHDRHGAARRVQPQDGAGPADAGPDLVGEQGEAQLPRGQPRAVSHPGRQPQPAQRRPPLGHGHAVEQEDGGPAAPPFGRSV